MTGRSMCCWTSMLLRKDRLSHTAGLNVSTAAHHSLCWSRYCTSTELPCSKQQAFANVHIFNRNHFHTSFCLGEDLRSVLMSIDLPKHTFRIRPAYVCRGPHARSAACVKRSCSREIRETASHRLKRWIWCTTSPHWRQTNKYQPLFRIPAVSRDSRCTWIKRWSRTRRFRGPKVDPSGIV